MMRKWISAAVLAAVLWLSAALPAAAQYTVVASCPGTVAIYAAGQSNRVPLVDVNGNLCTVVGGGGSGAGAGAQPYNYTPLTPEQHNLAIVTSTALTVPATSLQAIVCVRGNNVNYTYDGATTPTASVGMPLATGQCIQFSGATVLTNLRFIQTAATATLDVSYTK